MEKIVTDPKDVIEKLNIFFSSISDKLKTEQSKSRTQNNCEKNNGVAAASKLAAAILR